MAAALRKQGLACDKDWGRPETDKAKGTYELVVGLVLIVVGLVSEPDKSRGLIHQT